MTSLIKKLLFLACFSSAGILSAQPVPFPGWPNRAIPFSSTWVPELANLDSLPDLEIVVGFAGDSLYVWKTDATNLSPWPRGFEPGYVSWNRIAAVGDVDGDRQLEIVISSSRPRFVGPTKVHIFKRDGQELEGWPIVLPTWRDVEPVLADLNLDGKLEIIFDVMTETLVYVYDYTGKPYPGWPQKIRYELNWGRIGSAMPAVGDLDRDGSLEIVAFAFDNLYAWHADGTLLEGFPVPPPAGFYYFPNPVLSDLDRDGKLEIITDGYEPILPDLRGFVTVCDYKGQTKPGFPRFLWTMADGAPSVGDLDQDGYKEIVAQTGGFYLYPENKNVFVFRPDGSDYPGTPFLASGYTYYQMALADVDGDGLAEIITARDTCYNRHCYWAVGAYKLDGTPAKGFPLWTIGDLNCHTPAFADIDHNDTLDLAFITDTPIPFSNDTTFFFVWLYKLSGVPYDPSALPWPQYGHDDYNTNNSEFKISYKIGDPNADGRINVVDVVYLVNFIFKRTLLPNPLWNSDVNCNGQVNLSDVIYLANFVFKDTNPPCQ